MIDAPGPWGTGPFVLTEGTSSISTTPAIISARPFMSTWLLKPERSPVVTLDANPWYFDRERGPRVRRIRFRNDLSPSEALERCLNTEGEVDLVTEVAPQDAGLVQSSRFARLVAVESSRLVAGNFNRHVTDIPFSDRRLREALNLAVDRQQLVRDAFAGYAIPSAGLTPPWARDFPAGVKPGPFDPERARALLHAAGWPVGRSLRLAAPEKMSALVALIAAQMETALQIRLHVQLLPEEQLLVTQRVLAEKKLVPNWDLQVVYLYAPFFGEMSPAFFHREFFGADGSLRAGPPMPDFDKMMGAMAAEVNEDRRLEIARQIDRYVWEECLALFLVSPAALYAVNRHVQFEPYRTVLDLTETSVDEQHWSRRK